MLHFDLKAGHRRHQSGLFAADQQAVARRPELQQIVAEDDARNGQMKGADALIGDDGDGVHDKDDSGLERLAGFYHILSFRPLS